MTAPPLPSPNIAMSPRSNGELSPRSPRSPHINERNAPSAAEEEFRSRVQGLTHQARQLELSPRSPVSARVRENSESHHDENVKVRGSPDEEDVSDPESDAQESFSPAVYTDLANTMSAEAHKQIRAGNYPKAEAAHWKALRYLEDRENKLGIPFQNRDLMLEELAGIQIQRKKYEPARTLLSNLLKQEEADSKRKWSLYYMLATVYAAQDRLPEAEKFAKRAYIGREKTLGKGHAMIEQSADQLISIYDKLGDDEAAQAFRDLHPNERHMRDNPLVYKHVGTTRVAWNPDLTMDMNIPTKGGKTILINAVASGDELMVAHSLQKGADIEKPDRDGITPLMYAVLHNEERIASVLLSRGANPESRTLDWPPLHKACDNEDLTMIKTLTSYSAVVDSRAPKKFKLARILSSSRRSSIVDFIEPELDTGSDEDDAGQAGGWTPLLRAALRGQDAVIALLLDSGADLEARNPGGLTALSIAAEQHHTSTVAILLARGANINTQDKRRWTPIHHAQLHCTPEGLDTASALLARSPTTSHTTVIHINARCEKGMTPLQHAIERDNEAMITLLLSHGADISSQDVVGRTSLHTAVELRREAIVQLLLHHGANLDLVDARGDDPLAAAKGSVRRSPTIVRLLEKERKRRKGSLAAVSSSPAYSNGSPIAPHNSTRTPSAAMPSAYPNGAASSHKRDASDAASANPTSTAYVSSLQWVGRVVADSEFDSHPPASGSGSGGRKRANTATSSSTANGGTGLRVDGAHSPALTSGTGGTARGEGSSNESGSINSAVGGGGAGSGARKASRGVSLKGRWASPSVKKNAAAAAAAGGGESVGEKVAKEKKKKVKPTIKSAVIAGSAGDAFRGEGGGIAGLGLRRESDKAREEVEELRGWGGSEDGEASEEEREDGEDHRRGREGGVQEEGRREGKWGRLKKKWGP